MTHLELLPESLVVLVLSLACIIGILVLLKKRPTDFGEYKSAFRMTGFCQNYYWMLMASRLVLVSIMVFGNTFKYNGFVCLIVPICMMCLIAWKKPYKTTADVGRAVTNEIITFIILGIYAYDGAFESYTNYANKINTILPYIVIGLLIVCVAMNLAFLIKILVDWIKEKRQMYQEKNV
jgi:hypothetical protein